MVPSVYDELNQKRPYCYATTNQRFINFIVDTLVFLKSFFHASVMLVILNFSLNNCELRLQLYENSIFLCRFFIFDFIIVYPCIERLSKGKFPGKLITKTKVVKNDYTEITWKDAFVRTICRLIAMEPISDIDGHPWHDSLSKTFAIKNKNY